MNRYFTNTLGPHRKFWEVTHDPGVTSYTRRWGKIGTQGQTEIYQLGSEIACLEEIDRLVREKIGKGYVEGPGHNATARKGPFVPTPMPSAPAPYSTPDSTPLPLRLAPMLALNENVDVADLPKYAADDDYVFEQKLDGHRVILQVHGDDVEAFGRNGQTSQHENHFRKRRVAKELARLGEHMAIVLDGEFVDGKFWIFDMPYLDGAKALFTPDSPWHIRRRALGLFFNHWEPDDTLFGLIPFAEGQDAKAALADRLEAQHAEGVIIKSVDGTYRWGARSAATLRAKFRKTADVVITAVGRGGKANAVISVVQNSGFTEVGAFPTDGKGVAFCVGMVVTVTYLYLGAGNKLVQTQFERVRTDKEMAECTFDQLVPTNKEVLA